MEWRDLVKMHMPGSEVLGVGPRDLHFNRRLGWVSCPLKFENYLLGSFSLKGVWVLAYITSFGKIYRTCVKLQFLWL